MAATESWLVTKNFREIKNKKRFFSSFDRNARGLAKGLVWWLSIIQLAISEMRRRKYGKQWFLGVFGGSSSISSRILEMKDIKSAYLRSKVLHSFISNHRDANLRSPHKSQMSELKNCVADDFLFCFPSIFYNDLQLLVLILILS